MNPLTIKTVEGKDIVFDDICIRVSTNEYIKSGYFVEVKMKGKLPRCRKSSILTIRYRIGENIYVGPLYGYGEAHKIDQKIFCDMLSKLPVTGYQNLEITPVLEVFARQEKIELYGRN